MKKITIIGLLILSSTAVNAMEELARSLKEISEKVDTKESSILQQSAPGGYILFDSGKLRNGNYFAVYEPIQRFTDILLHQEWDSLSIEEAGNTQDIKVTIGSLKQSQEISPGSILPPLVYLYHFAKNRKK